MMYQISSFLPSATLTMHPSDIRGFTEELHSAYGFYQQAVLDNGTERIPPTALWRNGGAIMVIQADPGYPQGECPRIDLTLPVSEDVLQRICRYNENTPQTMIALGAGKPSTSATLMLPENTIRFVPDIARWEVAEHYPNAVLPQGRQNLRFDHLLMNATEESFARTRQVIQTTLGANTAVEYNPGNLNFCITNFHGEGLPFSFGAINNGLTSVNHLACLVQDTWPSYLEKVRHARDAGGITDTFDPETLNIFMQACPELQVLCEADKAAIAAHALEASVFAQPDKGFPTLGTDDCLQLPYADRALPDVMYVQQFGKVAGLALELTGRYHIKHHACASGALEYNVAMAGNQALGAAQQAIALAQIAALNVQQP